MMSLHCVFGQSSRRPTTRQRARWTPGNQVQSRCVESRGWLDLPRASVPLFSLHHLNWTGLDRAKTPQFLVDPSQPCPRPTGGVWSAPRRAQISVAPASQSASLFLSRLTYTNPQNSRVMFFPESLNFNRTIRLLTNTLRKWVWEL